MSEPLSAEDPRPGGVPAYIPNRCEDCGGPLVLMDSVRPPDDLGILFHDEFTCPVCRNSCYMDWSPEEMEAFTEELRAALKDPPIRKLTCAGEAVPL